MLLRDIIRIRRRRHLDNRWAEVLRCAEGGCGCTCATYNILFEYLVKCIKLSVPPTFDNAGLTRLWQCESLLTSQSLIEFDRSIAVTGQ